MFNINTKKLKINFFIIFLAFCATILIIYITTPTPEVIIKYPSIHHSHKIIYNDDNQCYTYIPKEVPCE